jgi:hypothetical protein
MSSLDAYTRIAPNSQFIQLFFTSIDVFIGLTDKKQQQMLTVAAKMRFSLASI